MKLRRKSMDETGFWQRNGIRLPSFDLESVIDKTANNPEWIHFGGGNIFRAFIADVQQELLEKGAADTGIIVAETFDYDIIDKIYNDFDNLGLAVLMHPDGSLEKKVIASVTEGLKGDYHETGSFDRLKEIFRNPSLKLASFTITEKGYALQQLDGSYLPVIAADIAAGPSCPGHVISFLTALLLERYLAGGHPLSVVSLDNCSRNGEKLARAVLAIAREWEAQGFTDKDFLTYLTSEDIVSFPWSMIDKITPRPDKAVRDALAAAGLEEMDPIITSRGTYIAPFVNAEVPRYLVIEDTFPNGRPPLEQVKGVYLTDRETVNKTERMKVTTCLNPLHTALSIFGCLLGYSSIAAEMKDEELVRLVERIGCQEGMPVVVHPGILNPEDFIHEVISVRLPNPYIPDSPQRIATDTSQKMAIRFGETIKAYLENPGLDAAGLTAIPLTIAGWCRYLLGVDDEGKKMELSSDPMMEDLTKLVSGVRLGDGGGAGRTLRPLLMTAGIFGVDLYQAGLGERIEGYFDEMAAGPGAVRKTLKKYL